MTISDAEQARRATRYEAVKRVGILFTAAVVTVSLALLVALAVQNRALLHTVNDCTQPGGECKKRGEEQTAQAVSNINQVIIVAAACSADLPQGLGVPRRQSLIQACVIDRLAAKP